MTESADSPIARGGELPKWWPSSNPYVISDCRNGLKTLPDCVIDAIVTDPPYELGFMGKAWDSTGIAYDVDMWREALRVLKPGGHLLAFGGSRTHHRMACAIEDAGFEVRDMIEWMYGSGFPKSHNIGKAVDKLQGNEREVVGKGFGTSLVNQNKVNVEQGFRPNDYYKENIGEFNITKGTSDWEGWGTALKPAHEPICMARKPLEKGLTVAENVLKWGTGGINVDGCRVATGDDNKRIIKVPRFKGKEYANGEVYDPRDENGEWTSGGNPQGRFPANLIHDGSDEVLKCFPETSSGSRSPGVRKGMGYGGANGDGGPPLEANSGSAARFFYCAKASKSERNRNTEANNNVHPTVKPVALIEYLIKLVTPKNGIVLDPFLGSGTTIRAAQNIGFVGLGFEFNAEYEAIIRDRIFAGASRLDRYATPSNREGGANREGK